MSRRRRLPDTLVMFDPWADDYQEPPQRYGIWNGVPKRFPILEEWLQARMAAGEHWPHVQIAAGIAARTLKGA